MCASTAREHEVLAHCERPSLERARCRVTGPVGVHAHGGKRLPETRFEERPHLRPERRSSLGGRRPGRGDGSETAHRLDGRRRRWRGQHPLCHPIRLPFDPITRPREAQAGQAERPGRHHARPDRFAAGSCAGIGAFAVVLFCGGANDAMTYPSSPEAFIYRRQIARASDEPGTTTGGNAPKFRASVRLDIRKIGVVKNGEQVVGNRARVKVVKNKVAPPFREAEFDILYGVGVNVPGEIVDHATTAGLFEKSGSFYSFKGERIAQGRDRACAYVAERPEVAQEVRLTLLQARKAENAAPGAPAPPAVAAAQAA